MQKKHSQYSQDIVKYSQSYREENSDMSARLVEFFLVKTEIYTLAAALSPCIKNLGHGVTWWVSVEWRKGEKKKSQGKKFSPGVAQRSSTDT